LIRYMLDTDTASYLLKKRHPLHKAVLNNLTKREPESVSLSVMTLSEMAAGLAGMIDKERKSILAKLLEEFMASINIIEFNDEAAWLYGTLRAKLRESGQDIGVMDTLIAAHAISQNLILVTNNHSHFKRITGLKCENWTV